MATASALPPWQSVQPRWTAPEACMEARSVVWQPRQLALLATACCSVWPASEGPCPRTTEKPPSASAPAATVARTTSLSTRSSSERELQLRERVEQVAAAGPAPGHAAERAVEVVEADGREEAGGSGGQHHVLVQEGAVDDAGPQVEADGGVD